MIRISLVRVATAAAFGIVLGLAPVGSASAASGDSPEARALCMNDAMAACGQCGANEQCYRACLPRKRRHEISDACYFFIHKPRRARRHV